MEEEIKIINIIYKKININDGKIDFKVCNMYICSTFQLSQSIYIYKKTKLNPIFFYKIFDWKGIDLKSVQYFYFDLIKKKKMASGLAISNF